MGLQIFVEDQLTDAYEVLALQALRLPISKRDRSKVRASRVRPDELGSFEGLLELLGLAIASGYDCVMFILDEEDPLTSPDRAPLLRRFRDAFIALCEHQKTLRADDPLRTARITRICCRSCLESWLVADPQAIVDAVRGGSGLDYQPPPQTTDNLSPSQAGERIAHIIQEVGRRLRRDDLRRVSPRSVKSRGKSIAERLQPERARKLNASLDYFFSMVDGSRSGCDHPFPDRG